MLNPYKLREDFPILNRRIGDHPLIYFDNAATTQKPKQVIEAVKEFYEKYNANVHRAVHTLSQEATGLYEEAHVEAAEFIGADGMKEIVFVRGATEAINMVAYSWGLWNLGREDEVLVTLMEHHSNIVPWEILSKIKGFRVKYASIHRDGTLNYKSFERQLSNKVRIVCLPQVSNVTGAVNDVKKIARVAHDYGALVLVDAAQSAPHMPINVKELDVDFLAFSGHKMLGPTGIGVLYGKKEILERMMPFHGGGEMIRQVSFNHKKRRCRISWNDLPWKFEAGTPDIGGAVGLAEAIEYLKMLGMENVMEHERRLTEYCLKHMQECRKVEIYGPTNAAARSGIVSFNVKGVNSHDLALTLDSYGIMVRSGYHCAQPLHQTLKLPSSARASFYIYNTIEEIDCLVEVIKMIEAQSC